MLGDFTIKNAKFGRGICIYKLVVQNVVCCTEVDNHNYICVTYVQKDFKI